MNSRKRQARQPLLPIRNPKQPRLALTGYSGGTLSPSETEGIRSRWLTFAKEFIILLGDTFTVMAPSIQMNAQIEGDKPNSAVDETPSPVLDSPSSSNSTPRQPSVSILNSKSAPPTYPTSPPPAQTSLDPQTSPIPNTFNSTSNKAKSMLLAENIPLPPSPPHFRFGDRNTYSPNTVPFTFPDLPGQSTPKNNVPSFASPTPAVSPTPTRIPAHSTHLTLTDSVLQRNVVPNMQSLHLANSSKSSVTPSSQNSKASSLLSDTEMSQTSRRSSQPSKRDPLRRNPRTREHIFAQVHKANVQRQKLELREQMTREIYEVKRKTGYTSGFSDFKGLLDYQRKLQNVDLEDAQVYTPLSLRGSLHVARLIPPRRQALEMEDDTQFLQRALDNAKATLNSPKPPRPFIPTFEQLQISRRAKDDDIERRIRPPVAPLPQKLPFADEKKVDEVLRTRNFVSKFAREQVSQSDLLRLQPSQWLNDEIINFYGAMLLGRSENCKENPVRNGKKGKKVPLNVHYFSSFFWTKLVQEGYDRGRLAKWTKKIDIFSKDIVFMPVNHNNLHWTAAAINFRAKRFESYDSMGLSREAVFRKLREYVKAEHQNKKKKDFDFTGWEDWDPKASSFREHPQSQFLTVAPSTQSTPKQENGFDCGVFTCQFMESLSRGEEFFNFSQEDIPYLRRRMIWEIAHAMLRDDR